MSVWCFTSAEAGPYGEDNWKSKKGLENPRWERTSSSLSDQSLGSLHLLEKVAPAKSEMPIQLAQERLRGRQVSWGQTQRTTTAPESG